MPMTNFLISLFMLTVSCTSIGNSERVFTTAHFKILYTALDDKNIKEVSDSLENFYPGITKQLQSGDLPTVNIHFYENVADLHKVFPDLPSWAIGQATSVSEIHMISPNNPNQDYQTMIRNTKHEFVHCVSMKINPTIGNNPRWLWESVAIYEANLPWDPHMLTYLINQKPPTLNELNQLSNTSIYEVGYFIGDFIVTTKGASALNSLIKNNGNLEETLNIDGEEFTKQWFAFIKKKYSL